MKKKNHYTEMPDRSSSRQTATPIPPVPPVIKTFFPKIFMVRKVLLSTQKKQLNNL